MPNVQRRNRDFGTADVGDWVRENFGIENGPKYKAHKASKQDLKRVPEARDFRRDNPDADMEDYKRWSDAGRLKGKQDK